MLNRGRSRFKIHQLKSPTTLTPPGLDRLTCVQCRRTHSQCSRCWTLLAHSQPPRRPGWPLIPSRTSCNKNRKGWDSSRGLPLQQVRREQDRAQEACACNLQGGTRWHAWAILFSASFCMTDADCLTRAAATFAPAAEALLTDASSACNSATWAALSDAAASLIDQC